MGPDHQLRTFVSGDLTLSYEVHGSGERTLVYLHGLLLDAAVNRQLARDLAAAGNRVILLDLPGHGGSDKPLLASSHRMDSYAKDVLTLLDELEVEQAVIGGMSLGADVSLLVAALAPERVAALVIEMPVLERATPYAAMMFTPLLAAMHAAAPVFRLVTTVARKIPRGRFGLLDTALGPLVLDPEEVVAILHGVLVGPVAPTAQQRRDMHMPTLVLGHSMDRLHSMGDATRLAKLMPNARLIQAHSIFELRTVPRRLTGEVSSFLDEVWSGQEHTGKSRTRQRSA